MTTSRKIASAGVLALLAAAIAGCSTSGGGSSGGGGVRPAPTGVEGAWLDAKGTGLSTFAAGSFQTVATDTGQKLSDGTYILTGANSVQINGTSLIRQSPISFNCLLISANQLNCTSSAGQQFTLTRRTA
ncbi:hypothetical protein N7E70_009980 [Aminobacter sp. NyZ550]|jgi:hypothetical protein|uniref:Membrane protein n=2 Tax=Aminobacter TaxID=31988 RepID=A0AAC8YMB4_AMIAI|nr:MULTISPECIES: hypothetical protein [Aminobacter]AMS40962.1 membrane protein [Aminobacter aminovorans]MBA8908944.1 hypothetical protein [Aminobacter ciceronei]MBA9022806.1 hypothetical protein [Aminobacter ciceronei]MBB3709698.1 hypothetical protein [Aminobacter aminovorans]MRX37429.1 hypothetical protein [Aminobacter sp. MDW-2]